MAAARDQGLSMMELARRSGETTKQGKYAGYNPHTRRGLPRHRLVRYGEALGNASLRRLGSPEIIGMRLCRLKISARNRSTILPCRTAKTSSRRMLSSTIRRWRSRWRTMPRCSFGHKIAIFSLEMSKEQLVARMLSMDAGVDQQKLRTGNINDEEWDRISESVGRLSEANIYIDDTPGITMVEMRSKARRLMMEHGFDLLIVDYLQLMQGSGAGRGHENRVQEISEISRGLKGLARELNVPVMALSQLSRAVESRTEKKPQLSDLSESGIIEQDADIVMFIYRDEVYNPDSERKNIADIIVAKHRNGPIGTVSLYFQAAQTRYRDLDLRTPDDF